MKRFLGVFSLAALVFTGFPGLSLADECGTRGYDGTNIVKFDCEPEGTTPPSHLQVRTSTGIRGIKLVDPAASNASKFRVRYTDTSVTPNVNAVKAIAALPPAGTITSCEELQMIGYHPDYPSNGTYRLGTDIDCSATNPSSSKYAAGLWGKGYYEFYQHKGKDGIAGTSDDNITALNLANLGAQGFNPIGSDPTVSTYPGPFTGLFEGNSRKISNLFINRPSLSGAGLFGCASGGFYTSSVGINTHFGVIQNVGIVGVRIIGNQFVGGLVGVLRSSFWVLNCYASGSVTGKYVGIGGLVGEVYSSAVMHSFATVSVTQTDADFGWAGGLVGGTGTGGSQISDCYATGSVTGKSGLLGGVAGFVNLSLVVDSYATGNVTGTGSVGYIGGLAGYLQQASVISSYATGKVTGPTPIGGLAGYYNVLAPSSVSNSYFTDNTHGSQTGKGTYEPNKATLYSKAHSVYNGSNAWNFTNTWKPPAGAPPKLKWE